MLKEADGDRWGRLNKGGFGNLEKCTSVIV